MRFVRRTSGKHSSPGLETTRAFARAGARVVIGARNRDALFAVQLDAFGKRDGVRAFSVHPGKKIATSLPRHLTRDEMRAGGWIDAHGAPADPTVKTSAQGAATQVWAATSAVLAGLGGLYCEDCNVARVAMAETADRDDGVRPHAIDPEHAARLWELSARMTGVDVFASAAASRPQEERA